jgi:hypothetical protein
MPREKPRSETAPEPARTALSADRDSYGVLVGWTHSQFDGRIDLRLQTAASSGALAKGEVDNQHVVMTPNQATLLANYLFTITNQSPPPKRKRGLLSRWFGS